MLTKKVKRKQKKIDHKTEEHAVPQKEALCLNCGSLLTGKYCSICGQKHEELHLPFWTLFADAFADFWHFDTKFFRTFLPLIYKPGFITLEYIRGRRAGYVHPIRLYFL
jgi:hypothetical protein